MILLFIPIFEFWIYPCLGKLGLLKNPLHRMAVGCMLMVLSFIAAGLLELKLEVSMNTCKNPENLQKS